MLKYPIMDLSFLNTLGDKLNEVGKFLFETFPGIAILIGGCLLVTLIIAVILEFKTRDKFKNHEIEEEEENSEDEAPQNKEDTDD